MMFHIRTVLEAIIDIFGCAWKVKQISSERPLCEAVPGRVNRPAKLILLFHRAYLGTSA
jgi:hypothetical protein